MGRWQPERLTEGAAMGNLRRRDKGGNNARLFRGLRSCHPNLPGIVKKSWWFIIDGSRSVTDAIPPKLVGTSEPKVRTRPTHPLANASLAV